MTIEKNGYYFTKVNPTTKQRRYMLYDFARAGYKSIYDAYGKPSKRKMDAYEDCELMREWCNGYSGRVSSRSTTAFSYMFAFDDNEGSYIVKVTKDNNFIMKCGG